MKRQHIWIVLLGLMSGGAWLSAAEVATLRTEYRTNPLGIDVVKPRVSWILNSEQRGEKQTAYQVLVASTPGLLAQDKGDTWDSGKVAAEDTTGVVYAGKELSSGERCFWKVKVWDKDGHETAWSPVASWSMGLLQPKDWKAEWIGFDKPRKELEAASPVNPADKIKPLLLPPPVQVRTEFTAEKKVVRAVLYATGLGIFDLYLNGKRVTEDSFSPGWTDYRKRVLYRAYEVGDMLRKGNNVLGAVIADGWFSGYVGYGHKRDHYGKNVRLKAQLQITFEDGSTAVIASGPDWKASTGPIRQADFLMGETYDATQELTGWAEPGFDAGKWSPVDVGSSLNPAITAHPGPPVCKIAEFKPRSINEPKLGVFVCDLGQNFSGFVRLKVKGVAGQKITLRYAERLNPDGTVYTTNLRSARSTDTYICRGGAEQTWQPRFTFHGFQYVEVTGLGGRPEDDTLTGVALGSDTLKVGNFECSNPMLNQLFSNIYWTQRMNFIDIPTDCPQRDERLGWTGDAQIYIRTATQICDVQAFYTKWLADLADAQRADGQFPMVAPLLVAGPDGGPAWADAGVVCPWTIYEVYGDKRLLAEHYDGMKRYVEFTRKRCRDGLLPPEKYHCFGDWLSIGANTPKDVIYEAYFALATKLTARAATVLGKTDEAAQYNALFDQIKEAFNKAYVATDGRIQGNTQCGYVLAIAGDLLDPEKSKRAAQYLVADIEAKGGHLSTGFIGTKDLMLTLAKSGRNDVAYRLVFNDTFPSWGFSIKNGATSIWERWNGWTPDHGFGDAGMNSFAHYSFGAVYQWMIENIGGIRSDAPAFKKIIIAPQMNDGMNYAKTEYTSIQGRIATDWKVASGQLTLNVTIPANTTATVFVPAKDAAAVSESGNPAAQAKGVKFLRMDGATAVFELGCGTYRFVSSSATRGKEGR